MRASKQLARAQWYKERLRSTDYAVLRNETSDLDSLFIGG